MSLTKSFRNAAASAAVLGAVTLPVACAAEEPSAPPPIAIDVEFPSAAAAVAVDSVKIYVFDGAHACTDLIQRRQTQQALPATIFEAPASSPCQFQRGQNNSFELDLSKTYSILAVGDRQGSDFLVGCSTQSKFGDTKALPISLTFIDVTKLIPETTCAKLSDKCAGACN